MKKIGIYSMAFLMLGIGTVNSGCMGSWVVTKKVYKWNEHATGNKFVDNAIFWVLSWWFYGVTMFIDFALLNLIEFWTGSNPLAMEPGQVEKGIVKSSDGNTYQMTVTQNQYEMLALTGKKKGEKTVVFYTPSTQTWSIAQHNEIHPLATIHPDINKVEIFSADGSVSFVDMGTFNTQGMLKGSF